MAEYAAEVLLVRHPDSKKLGIDTRNFASCEALLATLKSAPKVIALPISEPLSSITKLLDVLDSNQWPTKLIYVLDSSSRPDWVQVLNSRFPFRVLEDFTAADLTAHLIEASVEFEEERQRRELLRLSESQQVHLLELEKELQDRVEKRQEQIKKATKRLVQTNHRTQILHQALIEIQRARTLREMEQSLQRLLHQEFLLEWLRVLFVSQQFALDQIRRSTQSFEIFETPLTIGTEQIGEAFFARPKGKPFRREDVQFFNQISLALALALDRLEKIQRSETFKQQWEATFDAISSPVCLTTPDFAILRTNKTFTDLLRLTPAEVIGRSCFQLFFGDHDSEDKLTTQKKFSFQWPRVSGGEERVYEVQGQAVEMKVEPRSIFLILFRDVTEDQKLERHILQSNKMAELGTIGSSIAHELNNPIGGMLSFIQLIKMDLKAADPLRPDIVEMERAAIKCKEIVQNLLGFSRRHGMEESEVLDAGEILDQTLALLKIQAGPLGITFEVIRQTENFKVYGHFNLLAQALKNVLQNSLEAIQEKTVSQPGFKGEINIRIEDQSNQLILLIEDNGTGISAKNLAKVFNPLYTTKDPMVHPGLGLTVAFQILTEHRGSLEIRSQLGSGTTAKISIPRPEKD